MIQIPDALAAPGLSVLDHAVALTEASWKGVAIYGMRGADCACDKGHNDSPSSRGKHPIEPGWQRRPLVDPTETRNALIRYSFPINLGIVLGLQTSGDYVIAIDVDDATRFGALVEAYGDLPDTAACASGRGTRIFFTLPLDAPRDRIKNITGIRAPGDTAAVSGVDMKAAGGQVVVAPSTHWTGATYAWTRTGDVSELPASWILAILSAPAVPEWVKNYTPTTIREDRRALRKGERYLQAAVTGDASLISGLKTGLRNDTLNKSAFRMFRIARSLMLPDQQGYIVRELTRAAGRAGLSRTEIAKTLESAARAAETSADDWNLPAPKTNGVAYTNGTTNGASNGVTYAPVDQPASGVYATVPPDDGPSPDPGRIELIMEDGRPTRIATNVARLLNAHPAWNGGPRFDRFTGRVLWPVNLPLPLTSYVRDDGLVNQDADEVAIQGWLFSQRIEWRVRAGLEIVHAGVMQAAKWRSYDSLTERVEALPRWDGTPRLDWWLVTYAGAAKIDAIRFFGRRWMISAIARAMRPGCVADSVLVLEGEQGIGKNRLINAIFGDSPWVESIGPYRIGHDVEADRIAGSSWIMHDDEMRTRRSDMDALKAWISKREDTYRLPYERNIITRARRAVPICSTNRSTYLDDQQNRRFLPALCGDIRWDLAERDGPQLLAEALAAYRAGEVWTINRGDKVVWAAAEAEQDARRVVDPLDFKLSSALQKYVSSAKIRVYTLADEMGFTTREIDKALETRIGVMLRDRGYVRRQIRSGDNSREYVYEKGVGGDGGDEVVT